MSADVRGFSGITKPFVLLGAVLHLLAGGGKLLSRLPNQDRVFFRPHIDGLHIGGQGDAQFALRLGFPLREHIKV